MMADEKIKNSNELEFAVFCIENVAAKLGVDAERVYQAFAEKSDILNGYIVPEYEVLHTQSREYIVDDLLDVMREGTEKVDNTVYIWYNVSIKYRRCFYDRTTAEIGAKSIHGNI